MFHAICLALLLPLAVAAGQETARVLTETIRDEANAYYKLGREAFDRGDLAKKRKAPKSRGSGSVARSGHGRAGFLVNVRQRFDNRCMHSGSCFGRRPNPDCRLCTACCDQQQHAAELDVLTAPR